MKSLFYIVLFSFLMAPLFGGIEYSATIGAIGVVIGELISPFIKLPGVAFMSVIPIQDAQSLFTKKLIAVYREIIPTTGFLRSFFTPIESFTKEVSIEVQRGSEKVAVDVYRHSGGNRNTFDKATEKIFIPPYYDEYFSANEHRLYDQVIAALSEGNDMLFAQMTLEQAENLMELQKKIERAIEFQAKEVLESGVVTLNSGITINFGRKSASLVDKGVGNYWNTATVSPFKDLENGCNFLRQTGKATGATFNVIMGSEALELFQNNKIVQDRGDIKSFSLDALIAPIRNSDGAGMHGQVSAGSYTVRIWSYPQFFEDAAGNMLPYIDPKMAIILPDYQIGKESYSAVPQLISNGSIPQKGRFLVADYVDEKHTAHEVHIKSAPLIVPVKVDQIYTVQVAP